MLRKLIIIALVLNTGYLQAQEYYFNPKNRELKLLKRNNFDPFYEGEDLQVNEYLHKAFIKNKNANGWLIASGVVSSIPAIAYVGFPGLAYGFVLKTQSRKQIQIAAALHLSEITEQLYSGSEDFRRPERKRWYQKKNFYVAFYSGQNEAANQALNQAWELNRKANTEQFYGAVTGSVGTVMLFVSLINFLVSTFDEGEDRPVLWPFTVGAALTTTGAVLIIRADKKKNQSELNLWNATEQWYSELHGKPSKTQ